MMIRYAILGLLRTGGARHGYGLLKEYRELSGCQLSVGNVYRELQRLLSEGLIATAANPPDADPRRTPYRLTPAGIAAFDAWLGAPRTGALADYHDEMTLRACLAVQFAHSPVADVLDRWRNELALRRSLFERGRSGPARAPGRERFDPVALLAGRRLRHISVDLEFVEELRAAYGAWTRNARGARAHRG